MTFEHNKDSILALDEDGQVMGRIEFPETEPGVVNIVHTQVGENCRGMGIAGKLMKETVTQLREEGKKAELSCSYAVKWMSSHPEESDILKDPAKEAKLAEAMNGPACGIFLGKKS